MSAGIARAILILMLGNVASRLLGIVREQVIAGLFGASAATDAFTAAFKVPTTLYDLLIGGMISAALVPVFSDYADPKRQRELWYSASIILNLAFLVLTLATGLIALLAPQVIAVFGYGFEPEVQNLAIHLLRLMSPAIIFMGLSGFFTALLYSRQHFTLPAFCVALYNAGIAVAAIALHSQLEVSSLVVGVLLGAFLQMAVQWLGLKKMHYSFTLDFRNPAVRRILALYTPVALGVVVSAIGVTIDSNLVSRTGEGNMAAMRFATTLVQFPLGLIAAATSFAILPTLSRHAAEITSPTVGVPSTPLASQLPAASVESGTANSNIHAYKKTLATGLKMMLLAIIPATVGLVVLRIPVVQILFERGAFDIEATNRTALAFLAYAPGLPAAAIDQLLIFAFYARRNTITPVLVGVMSVGVYLVVGLSLLGPLGMPGLALANSAQWISHAVVMFFLTWRALGGLRGLGLGSTAVKTAGAALIMGILLSFAGPLIEGGIGTGSLGGLATYLTISVILGAAVYGAVLVLLRVEEVQNLRQRLHLGLLGSSGK